MHALLVKTTALHEQTWTYVVALLPPDFEEGARSSRALIRYRNVPNAAALLRLALAYAVSGLSLKDVAAWAHALGVAEITGPGLFYRLREAQDGLEQVLAGALQAGVTPAPVGEIGRVRIADASVITGPGSAGADWGVHVQVEPATGTLHSVEVTDAHGGERCAPLPLEPGDVVLGDQA